MEVFELASLDTLFDVLKKQGYTVVGPTVRDETIVYDELESTKDLPIGWGDEQDNGKYRLKKRKDGAYFGFTVGPHTWKKFLFPPQDRLWSANYGDRGFEVKQEPLELPKYALIGVRSCELHAIEIQDKVFTGGPFVAPRYKLRRKNSFTVVVNCGQASGTCFCVSMNTGPKADRGFDLALTEIVGQSQHYFTVEAGTEAGEEVLAQIPHKAATKTEETAAEKAVERAASQMGRKLDTTNIKELFYNSFRHPRWVEMEKRCLACANCTMVCPTCFCTSMEDRTDLTGKHTERWRVWDSCFDRDFSFIVGGSIRQSTKARYRQWITHKLAYWMDQFGTLGCVGCGRCITWCPVGIDITEEARAVREGAAAGAAAGGKTLTQSKKEEQHGDA